MKSKLIAHSERIQIEFISVGQGWLLQNLKTASIKPPIFSDFSKIEKLASTTELLGAQPLWQGYEKVSKHSLATSDSQRTSEQVRSSAKAGRFFAWLAEKRQPNIIVEFGTAFGVSGMYWLAGLKKNERGHLLTFEPNETWANIARGNLFRISDRFDLTVGTFEENIDAKLNPTDRIDIAFVDGIHTSAFVNRQFEILLPRMISGGIMLFDDVNFSDDMGRCWQSLARDPRIHASATIDQRLGIVELAKLTV
jgi:predicted O-methyltransferase YrrM